MKTLECSCLAGPLVSARARTIAPPDTVSLFFMSLRSDLPLWECLSLRTDSEQYRAIKALKLATSHVVDGEGVQIDGMYLQYVRTDEDAYRVYLVLRCWPRTHTFKEKILRYMKDNSKYLLP